MLIYFGYRRFPISPFKNCPCHTISRYITEAVVNIGLHNLTMVCLTDTEFQMAKCLISAIRVTPNFYQTRKLTAG